MKNILVVGAGHVGLVTAACLADLGNKVIAMDDDTKKIEHLKKGLMPFYEPGLGEIVHRNTDKGRLFFTTGIREGVKTSEIIFICVGTPQKPTGEADISIVESVTKRIGESLDSHKAIVEKSTVPVRTGTWIKRTISANTQRNVDFDVICNPEFMREGSAIHDFMHPDRIVLGVETERAANTMIRLYKRLNAPMVVTNIETAELIKHASNSFLALKVSYINAIARICERVGADTKKVAEGIGYDKRIGREYLNAGAGYGGYCLPKDLSAFIKIAEEVGYDFELLKAVQKVNSEQRDLIAAKAKKALWNLNGKVIGILGLSFKPDTDDMREAPSIYIIKKLQEEGAIIKAYDPQAMNNAKAILANIKYCKDPYQLAKGCDAIIVISAWEEFRELDLLKIKRLLRQPVIIDGSNIYNQEDVKSLGFVYEGVGRC